MLSVYTPRIHWALSERKDISTFLKKPNTSPGKCPSPDLNLLPYFRFFSTISDTGRFVLRPFWVAFLRGPWRYSLPLLMLSSLSPSCKSSPAVTSFWVFIGSATEFSYLLHRKIDNDSTKSPSFMRKKAFHAPCTNITAQPCPIQLRIDTGYRVGFEQNLPAMDAYTWYDLVSLYSLHVGATSICIR